MVHWRRASERFPKPRPRHLCAGNPAIKVGVMMPEQDLERFQVAARAWAKEVGRPEQSSFSAYVRYCLAYVAAHRRHDRRLRL